MKSSQAVAVQNPPVHPVVNVKALNYKNASVVARLVEEGQMSVQDAEVLFDDTLKFLALAGEGPKLSPPARIDLGWHNFILFTRD